MGLDALGLFITIFWLAIHALHRIYKNSSHGSSNLPIPVAATLSSSARHRTRETSTRVTLNHVHLRIETSALNNLHARYTTRARASNMQPKKALTAFYNVGSIFGAVGMLGVLGIILWTLAQLIGSLMAGLSVSQSVATSTGHSKRAMEGSIDMNTQLNTRTPLLQPIVSHSLHWYIRN